MVERAATDLSGTVSPGDGNKQIAAANPARTGFWLQNQHATATLTLLLPNGTGGATSLQLGPGRLYESPPHWAPIGAISVASSTASHPFAAQEVN
jgi:hypothetical protein